MKKRSRRWAQLGLSLLALLIVGGIVFFLISSRSRPQSAPAGPRGSLVETDALHAEQTHLRLEAKGTVRPAREVELRAEVTGRVTEVSPSLEPGKRVSEGEVLVRIDPEEYRLRVQEAEAALVRAKTELALEQGRQEVAKQEWELFKQRVENEELLGDRSLALRKPQLAAAVARVQEAQTQLDRAQLNLQRSTVTAPFDAIVSSEQSELGQVLSAQTAIATLVGTDVYWVQVAVPTSRVENLRFPEEGGANGSSATVEFDTGEGTVEYDAQVAQLLPGMDPQGRMARVLLTVQEPFEGMTADEARANLPLLLDSYVEVEIETDLDGQYVRIPRTVLQDGDRVFVYRDGQLHIAEPDIVWRGTEAVWASGQDLDGARVITSPLAAAVEGMQLRLASEMQDDSGSGGNGSQEANKRGSEASSSTDQQSEKGGGFPWSWVILLLLVAGGAAGTWWWRKKRGDGGDPKVELVTVGKPLVLDPSARPLYSLPREAVKDGAVLLYQEGRIRKRKVGVSSEDGGRVLVHGGIEPGERVVCPYNDDFEDGDSVRAKTDSDGDSR